MRKYLIPIIGTILIACGYFCLETHESHSSEKIEFTINKPYLQVIRGLATKNSLEKIVEDGDGAVTKKNWDHFNVEIPNRIINVREYKVDGTLRFTVEKKDKDLGELILPFMQKMRLDRQILSLKTELLVPHPNIPLYEKNVEVSPLFEEDVLKTHVLARSELKIKRTIPFFMKKHMDEKVAKANRADLENLKTNIIGLSAQKSVVTFSRPR